MTAVSNRTKTVLNVTKIILQIIWNIFFYTVIVVGVIWLCKNVFTLSYQIYGDVRMEPVPGRDISLEIKEGEGTMELSGRLFDKGLIPNKYTFFIRAKLSTGTKRPILPGTYRVNTSMTYGEILDVVTNESTVETQ